MPGTSASPRPPGTGASPPASSGASRPAPPQTYSADRDVHILDRLSIIYRYRRIALSVFVLTTIAVMIQGYSNVQLYQAKAQVLIEDERSTAMPGIANADYYEDPVPYYNTQYRILRGRDLARRVVKKLDFQSVPEFNGTAKPADTPLTFVRNTTGRLLRLVRSAPAVAPEPPKPDETADESGYVTGFLGRVGVAPIPDSKLVDISFTSLDPKLAAQAANTLVDEYVAQNLEVHMQGTQSMLDWLGQGM